MRPPTPTPPTHPPPPHTRTHARTLTHPPIPHTRPCADLAISLNDADRVAWPCLDDVDEVALVVVSDGNGVADCRWVFGGASS